MFYGELLLRGTSEHSSPSHLRRSMRQEVNSEPPKFKLQRPKITHNHMTTFLIIILVLSVLYIIAYFLLSKYVEFQERVLIDLFSREDREDPSSHRGYASVCCGGEGI